MGDFFKGHGVTMKDTCVTGVPCTMYGDIYVKYGITFEQVDYFLPAEKAEKAFKGQYGDLLFTASGETAEEIGKCAGYFGNNEICIGGDIIVLRPYECYDSLFLSYLCNSPECIRQKAAMGQGDAVVHIKTDNIQNISLSLPESKEEQKRIASALSSIDIQIATTKKLLAKYESIKKATVKKLMMPKAGWKDTTIEKIADVVTGATPSTAVPEYWNNATIPWMSSGEINKRFISSTENYISQFGYDSSSTHLIRPNSVLVALAGQGTTRGKVAINRIELCTNQSLAAITPFRPEDYGYIFWNLDSRYTELRSISTGDGGRGGLNLHLIKTLPIHLPDEQERDEISRQLFSMSKVEDELHSSLTKLNCLKQSMLQYFFG